jgi:enediyne biosynthesis protein CalE5
VSTTSIQQQEDVRRHLHGMWDAVADGWREHAGYVDSRGAEITERLLAAAELVPGQRVLELACGPGSVGLAVAPLVAPGEVVLSDVAAEMVAVAAERAAEQGLRNVATRVLDIEAIDEPDASYDAVLCREGLMFATDHACAARELVRVLRPGGRAAVAVWGPRERNPWLGLVFDAVSEQIGRPVPPPGIPGPFALDDPDELAALLSGAGFEHVGVSELPTPLRAGSFEEWWTRTRALAGPLTAILAGLPAEATEAIERRLREAVEPYAGRDGLELPGVTLLAMGRAA